MPAVNLGLLTPQAQRNPYVVPVEYPGILYDYSMGPARPYRPLDSILDPIGQAANDLFGEGSRIVVGSGSNIDHSGDGPDLPRHGSNRHETGTAADFTVYRPDGSVVDPMSEDGQAYAMRAAELGILGVGFGPEYMGNAYHMDRVEPGPGQGHVWASGAAAMGDQLMAAMQGNTGVPGGTVASAAGRPASAPVSGQGASSMGRGGQQQEQQPFGQRLRDNFRSGGSGWDTLAVGLNGMTLRPDPGLQGLAGGRIADRREAEREERRLNQTAEWLQSIGRDDLAQAVMAGGVAPGAAGGIAFREPEDDRTNARRQYDELIALGVDPQVALDRAYGSGSNGAPVRVQSSEILEDGTTVTVMSDGTVGVVGPDGERITGQAAREAIEAARQFGVDNERAVYQARGEGRLTAEIDLGGEAAQVEQLGEDAANIAVGALEARTNIMSSVGNIDDALAALDRGAESGMIYNMLPRVSEAGASLQNAMDRMGLDVIGMVTFGALSEGELRLAMQTAVPRNLDSGELRTWLERRRTAQLNAARTLEDAAIFLSTPGNTINDWLTRNRAENQGGGEPEAAAPSNTSDDPLGLFQ